MTISLVLHPSPSIEPVAGSSTHLLIEDRKLDEDSRKHAVELLTQKGFLLEKMGRRQEALESWKQLLSFQPRDLVALHHLGDLLFAGGQIEQSEKVFHEAAGYYPDNPLTWVQIAKLLMHHKDWAGARKLFEYALSLDANCRPAHAGLAFVFAALGMESQAAEHGGQAFRGHCIIKASYLGDQPPIAILELFSTRGGNMRLPGLVSEHIFQRYLIPVEYYDGSLVLPPHQLVVNAIGDADCASAALAGAELLLSKTSAPRINAPAAVLRTGRAEIARRLASVTGVRTARTALLPRDLLTSSDVGTALGDARLSFPLLVRSPGFHGGEHFLRVEGLIDLPSALEVLPGEQLLVIEYLDARGVDGKFRKYRVMMVDGTLYPLHCAISSNWKIHYFSAEMADFPEHREEDAAFLNDMAGVLGERAMKALDEVQTSLNLDYGGIDFGLDIEGELLLFEANATMVIVQPDADARWDYRRPAVERASEAVRSMMLNRAEHRSPD